MKTILAAVDFSDVTDALIAHVATLARAFSSTVHVLHVVAPEPDFVGYKPGPEQVREQVAKTIADYHQSTRELSDRLVEQGVDAHCLVIQGPTAPKILEEAARLGADLLAIGSHGHGALRHLLLGSVSEGVVRNAPCPVLVVPSLRASDAGE